jgi:hypothetical protein
MKKIEPPTYEIYEGLPLFRCRVINKQFVFKCPFCKRTHRHGAVDNLDTPQHRVGHCNKDRDAKENSKGYWVVRK